MTLMDRRTHKPFREIRAEVTESDDNVYVGPNWIRTGQNVDCPMADAEARREVKMEATGRRILAWVFLFVLVTTLLGAVIWKWKGG